MILGASPFTRKEGVRYTYITDLFCINMLAKVGQLYSMWLALWSQQTLYVVFTSHPWCHGVWRTSQWCQMYQAQALALAPRLWLILLYPTLKIVFFWFLWSKIHEMGEGCSHILYNYCVCSKPDSEVQCSDWCSDRWWIHYAERCNLYAGYQ